MGWKFPTPLVQNHETDDVLGYTDTTFVNRNAKLQIARLAGLIGSSPAITPALHIIQQSHGDNSGFKPNVATYSQARDDSAVLTDADRGPLIAGMFEVVPLRARSNSPADDADGIIIANASDNASKGTDGLYVAQGSAFGNNRSFITGLQVAAYVDFDFFSGNPPGGTGNSGTGLELRKTYANYGIDFKSGTFTGFNMRFGNNQPGLAGRLANDSADATMLKMNTNNDVAIGNSGTIRVNTTASQLGFFGTTPVAKQTVSGAKGSNAALGSLIAALVAHGLITDTTTT